MSVPMSYLLGDVYLFRSFGIVTRFHITYNRRAQFKFKKTKIYTNVRK